MLNKLLDASIYYSFDKSGFLRHQKEFRDTYSFISESNALITGGTSGIGFACVKELIKDNVNVWITGRNAIKGAQASNISPLVNFQQLDMMAWNRIPEFIKSLPKLDYIVLNAGGMPGEFIQNEAGVESQFASQLFGHYYLIKALQLANKINSKARIVWVTSGGMYLKNLDLITISSIPEEYDKVGTYANVKRAQVTLLPFFQSEFPEQIICAMHPGWAQTPGVSSAIPKFDEKMKGRLRTALQGGDTILWLLGTKQKITSGKLYFDRKIVSPHLLWFTKKSEKQRKELIKIIKQNQPDLTSAEEHV